MNARSYVWDHYTRTTENNDQCKCNYCGKILNCVTSYGTTNLKKHLTSCKQYTPSQDTQHHTLSQDGIADGNLKLAKVSEDVFREASNEMLVLGELPFSFIESFAFKHFCSRVHLYEPHSQRKATKDIVEMYLKRKAEMKRMISVNNPRVSLTTDVWVAPTTGASYMVITTHFIDESWRLRKIIIGFKHILDHKAVSISTILLESLEEWGIEKIFTITVDNTITNTYALNQFKETFKSRRNDALVLDGEFMHMRCCTHILNLIVQDVLREDNRSVVAIRNGVEYVRSSQTKLKSFELWVKTIGKMTRKNLFLDVKTRWNSSYLMLKRALKFRLAFDKMVAEDKFYNGYFQEEDDGKKKIGPPTTDDWDNVERLVKILKIFYNSTLIVSSSTNVSSSNCYNEICTIEKKLISLSNSSDEVLSTKAIIMRDKFDKYWHGLEKINRLLIIASVFDPRKKMNFATMCFEELYEKDSSKCNELKDSIFDVMSRLFEEYKRVLNKVETSTQIGSIETLSQKRQNHINLGNGFDCSDDEDEYDTMDYMYNQRINERGFENANNELDIYLKEKVEYPKSYLLETNYDVLSWWRLNSAKFPVLSKIAKDVLAMQISTIASESTFRTSGRILHPYMSNLSHYMIEALVCTEQWIRCDIDVTKKQVGSISQILDDIEYHDKF